MATFFSTLVRTSGDGHQGLSLLVIEADLPGITVRKLPATGWWSGNTTTVTFNDVKVRGKKEKRRKFHCDLINSFRCEPTILLVKRGWAF